MANHLAGETSPYLLQHADNPVDWYPWGEEALTLARTQDKPILLSVGYSACHWCHVMAHECFEDAEVAALMNQYFINIKVDREERPDIDQIYQTALYMLTQRAGGWPLTLFLTPDQKPFFGGVYFPKTPRHGLPGLLDLLPQVAQAYYSRRDEIERQNNSMLKSFANMLPAGAVDEAGLTRQPLEQATTELKSQFDPTYGGFGNAPKFLHPAELEFCLRRYFASGDEETLHMATHTLQKMAEGGIYDQLGGGFYRYSTDESWHIPHFEKMLYDNGPLLHLYADAWLATENPLFKRIVEETAEWVMREMQLPTQAYASEDPKGGYYSAIDADSENEEGKFYLWNQREVAEVLSREEYAVVTQYYNVGQSPNYEHERWHLEIARPLADVAEAMDISLEEAGNRLRSARRKLFVTRESRVHPGRDEKILTSWNGLIIGGICRAGRVFGRRDWIRSGARAVDFIRSSMWRNNRLLATSKDGKAHLNAYLDDHAFLLDGLLELMQAEFRKADLEFAINLADVLLEQFEDHQAGGFFFTSHDHEQLIHRPKPVQDGAMPSGNGVAAYALQRLGHLLGDSRYLQAAERSLKLFYPSLSRYSSSCCSLLIALDQWFTPPQTVILQGAAAGLGDWTEALRGVDPSTLVIALSSELEGLPLSLGKPATMKDDVVNARVCQGVKCLPEISDLHELLHVCKFHGNIKPPSINQRIKE